MSITSFLKEKNGAATGSPLSIPSQKEVLNCTLNTRVSVVPQSKTKGNHSWSVMLLYKWFAWLVSERQQRQRNVTQRWQVMDEVLRNGSRGTVCGVGPTARPRPGMRAAGGPPHRPHQCQRVAPSERPPECLWGCAALGGGCKAFG